MMRVLSAAILSIVIVGASARSEAHYFWVQPEKYEVGKTSSVTVRLFVGHAAELKEYPHVTPAYKRFVAIGPRQTKKMTGKLGANPAGRVTLTERGVHALVYDSHHSFARLEPAKFDKYLREKGLDAVIAERVRRGESQREGRESYARCAKALVRVGSQQRGYARRARLPLELTPLDNPFKAKRKVRFVLELSGKPLAGALVELVPLDVVSKNAIASARTDARGRVRFKIPKAGRWMVASVHMRRAKKPVSGDWESFWANVTFSAR